MLTTIELPESVYQQSAEVARKLGVSVGELIVLALEREVAQQAPAQTASPKDAGRVCLPVIHSKNPGSMDLSGFDFDDLLT